jgi:hypothetical protein
MEVLAHTINPLVDQRWSEFVASHANASIFHTSGWLEALRRTHAYEPVVYTTSPPGTRLTNGFVFCRVNSWITGRRLVSLPFADHCEPLVDSPQERSRLLTCLQASAAKDRLKYIEIRPLHVDRWSEGGLQPGRAFWLHKLDLRGSLEDLFRGCHQKAIQKQIRRAQREGLQYETGRSEALLNDFYRLMLLTRRRHKLPPQPRAWFRNLIACLDDQLTISVASKEGEPIASILTLSFTTTLTYKYGCSDARFHNLGGVPFLLWKAIESAKRNGFQEFDLGRSDIDNPGLITFKERLGATPAMLTYLSSRAPGSRSTNEPYGMKIAERLFARMPDGLLIATGNLLYRHVG